MARDELLARVDSGWREFRARVRHLGRDGMARKTPVGWTYTDLVAHVAAWEDATRRRLRAFQERGERPGPPGEVDDFNAKVVAEHRFVGAEAILGELETAHRMLVEEIVRLDAVDDWIERIVAANTFGHYAEHAEELAAAV